MATFVIGFYELDRAYGGPEEGGWWYDCGQLVRAFRVAHSEAEAIRLCRRANDLLHRLQRNKRDIGSVIYSGGRHCAWFSDDGRLPSHWPETRPYYE